MTSYVINFKKLDPDATIPSFAKEGDAGFDLCSIEDVVIRPGETKLVRTGLAVELPANTELQIRPRSGLATKTPFTIPNSPGTVDEGYRGEICVPVYCRISIEYEDGCPLDTAPSLTICKGSRIAQAVLKPCFTRKIVMREVASLSASDRGDGGFGHTGV